MNSTKVLIIDDEAGFTHLVKITLEKSGCYEVCEENDARNAWQTARNFHPHIIFVDNATPGGNGAEIAWQIRSDASLAAVPIVFLTAIKPREEGHKSVGGFPFLSKPVSLAAITRCIDEHVRVV